MPLVIALLNILLVVRTTKRIINIKDAKDMMVHGSNPTVVVKSNVIILWVIIHQSQNPKATPVELVVGHSE